VTDRTVNQHSYLEVLARLREAVRRRRPELWPDSWILHYGNAPAHDALAFREFLAKKLILKLDRPPYSPDLAPCNFWLFPKLKTALKGRHSGTCDDHPEEEFKKCFEQRENTDSLSVLVRKKTTSKVTATISV
jgi:transposase